MRFSAMTTGHMPVKRRLDQMGSHEAGEPEPIQAVVDRQQHRRENNNTNNQQDRTLDCHRHGDLPCSSRHPSREQAVHIRKGEAYSAFTTGKTLISSSNPLTRWFWPRPKVMFEPVTRSRTVLETITSLPFARCATREAM